MKSFKFFLISIIFSLCTSGWAQTPTLFFKSLSSNNGLSSDNIIKIYQDQLGFLWFASINGLDKYDGYQVKHYNFTKNIVNRVKNHKVRIHKITGANDGSGSIFIASSVGLTSVSSYSDSIRMVSNPALDSLSNLKNIVTGSGDSLWIQKYNKLYLYTGLQDTLHQFTFRAEGAANNEIAPIVKILRDQQNRIWVASEHDLFLYLPLHNKFTRIKLKINIPKNDLKTIIMNFVAGINGDLWIFVKNSGLVRFNFDRHLLNFYSLSQLRLGKSFGNTISNMLYTPDSSIWIGSRGFGLAQFDIFNKKLFKYERSQPFAHGLEGNQIKDMFLDRSGVFWVAITGFGLNFFSYSSTKFYQYTIQNAEFYRGKRKQIYGVTQDSKNRIWLGPIKFGGIFQINPINNYCTYFPYSLENPYRSSITFTTILDAGDNALWVCSIQKGLSKFNTVTRKFSPYLTRVKLKGKWENLKIFNGFKDSKGYLWLNSLKNGIYKFNPQDRGLKRYLLDTTLKRGFIFVRSYLETRNGQLLFGLSSGNVYRFDAQKDLLVKYFGLAVEKTNTLHIRSLAEDYSGNIWMATNRGIFVYSILSQKIENYSEESGLVTRDVSALMIDNLGDVWASHKKGLSRFNTRLKRFTNYDNRQILDNNQYTQNNYFRTAAGKLIFGSTTGCTVIDPKSEIKNSQAALRLTEVKITSSVLRDDQIAAIKTSFLREEPLKLPYDNYGFTFEFSLLDYREIPRNHYAYRLLGQSEKWQDIGTRHSLSFVGLPAGKYTFCVRGTNASGDWSSNEIGVYFQIEVPFWKSWWFYTWIILIITVLLYTAYRLRVYAIRARNRELLEINKKLNDQMNIRHQVEQMLVENENKYRALVEGIAEGIFTLDTNGIFFFLNSTAAQRIGGEAEYFTGRSVYEFYSKKLADQLMDQVRLVLKEGRSHELNAEIPQNGKTNHYNVILQPLQNERGETNLALCIAVDTSEKIALENQLRQSQKMEAIGNLAGGIAHDFNNLLSVIRGYTFLLLADEKPGDSVYESLREIDLAGERAQGLTRQLLAFSRKQLLEPKVINLNSSIRNIHKMLGRLIRENIEIDLKLAPELNHIFVDPGQVEQVIMNLVLNAGDAMPLGGKVILETRNSGEPQELEKIVNQFESSDYVELIIADNGVGMDKETQQKIFDPFFTTKEKGKGTGLGLSTVFGIVKQSEGYIWVESTPGKGSTFSIYFPALDRHTIAEELSVTERKELRGSETILVVEDEKSVRAMIVKMLTLYGYKTFSAVDGKDGIRLFNKQGDQIDVILSDIVMPDMSGVEMMKQVTQTNPLCRYILMSGYTDKEIVRDGRIDRGLRFIQKPFTPDTLMAAIRKVMDS